VNVDAATLALWGVTDGHCDCGDLECRSQGKHPAPAAYENANPAIYTGARSGLVVVDLDRKPGRNGVQNFRTLAAANGGFPRTRTVKTGGGGLHLYFKDPGGVGNSASKIAPGVDVRGEGGLVVAAGAKHVSGNLYTVAIDTEPIDLPLWLLDLLTTVPAERSPPVPELPMTSELADAAERLAISFPIAVEGEGGNAQTLQFAMRLRDLGVPQANAAPYMRAYSTRCEPPWSSAELERISSNAYKYARGTEGARHPDPVQAVHQLGAAWHAGGGDSAKVPALIGEVNDIINRGVTPAQHALIARELTGYTGLTERKLGLRPPRDVEAEAARDERRERFAAGDTGLIDIKDPLATVRTFQASTADAEGMPAIRRHEESWWKHDRSRYVQRSEEHVSADLYRFNEGKADVNTNAAVKPDRTLIETQKHALQS
jgi:hypothetical protein